MGSMKMRRLSRGLSSWDNNDKKNQHDSQISLSLSCKRLCRLTPKLSASSSSSSSSSATSFNLKSFIKPEGVQGKSEPNDDHKKDSPQVETHPVGTRWNPTPEQIEILEMMYRGGIRTPNAQQIEQISVQLGKYGKIEGKNVFYWFQNHKARERQKQKRNKLSLSCQNPNPISKMATPAISLDNKESEDSPCKRTCRSWGFENLEIENKTSPCSNNKKLVDNVKTLELFPLYPELGRS